MSKRKRETEQIDPDSPRNTKKAKKPGQTQVTSDIEEREVVHVTANGLEDPRRDRSAQTKDGSINLQKQAKRERRKLKKEQQAKRGSKDHNHGKNLKNKLSTSKKKRNEQVNGNEVSKGVSKSWTVSDSVGGRMIDEDPVFSPDEEHLLIAYGSAVVVYSTATSTPIRYLRSREAEGISALALSSRNASELYISTLSGSIEKWDWTQGFRIGHWKLSSSIYALTMAAQNTEEVGNDLVYTVDKKESGPWHISAHRLNSGGDDSKAEVKTLHTQRQALSSMKVLEGGRFIIATSGSQLTVGNVKSLDVDTLQALSYTWRIVDCPEWIISIDVRNSQTEVHRKKSKGGLKLIDSLDIAIGGLRGSIHIYESLMGKLIRREQPIKDQGHDEITSRRLHWHRNAVLSLKWSLDGNYLISGGLETVLVLWQLDTGKKQNLPHLGAPIESIVVSPSGSSYAVRLADNSAMILSTTELRPKFSVAGIQISPGMKSKSIDTPFILTVDIPSQDIRQALPPSAPACISLTKPGSLLLAVPPSVPLRPSSKTQGNASYLQTFDTGNGHQISKQALTRTKITDLNMGPESNAVDEPNVILMQASADGAWLATIDEWTPPGRDLAFLASDGERLAEEQCLRKETYLKFWSFNDDSKTWELVSRFDDPHMAQSRNLDREGGVLGLSTDPSAVGFATIGKDNTVKIWKPVIRRRHGLNVRGKDGKNLASWSCRHVVALESVDVPLEGRPDGGRLAYSRDGSILLAALPSSITSSIYIINACHGKLRDIQTGLYSGPLLGLRILGRYMITLSNDLRVIDLVSDELHFGVNLPSFGLSLEKRLAFSHLAVDPRQELFAIALPEIKKNMTELRSRIAIFEIKNATLLYQTSFRNTITTLLPNAGRRGFIAVDSTTEIRTLAPSQSAPPLSLEVSEDKRDPSRLLGDIFSMDKITKALENGVTSQAGSMETENGDNIDMPYIRERNVAVVSPEKLAEVFNVGPSHAMPPVAELFERVASLYSAQKVS